MAFGILKCNFDGDRDVDMEDIKNIEIRPTISALLCVFNSFANTILFSAIYEISVISGFETRFTRVCNGWQRSAFHNKITLNCEILKMSDWAWKGIILR